MQSFKSKLLVFMLSKRRLFLPKKHRFDYIDHNTSISDLRNMVESGADRFGKLPDGFTTEPHKIGELQVEWLLPPGTKRDKAILYFHGGGLVVGSIKSHHGVTSKFAQACGAPTLLFDYGLAPEKPYPAGLYDSLAAYQFLLDQGLPPHKIVFMGDSGGGNLCLASLLAIKEKSLPMPAAAVVLSPWTDLTNSGESWRVNADKDPLTWKNSQNIFSEYYVRDNDPQNPLISPLFGDLSGLPPLQIYAGGHESMLSDSVRFAAKAQAAGVDVKLTVGEGLFHCYPACAPLFPEATQAMQNISEFIKSYLYNN